MHQPLTRFLVWAVVAHYSNAINIRQVYGTTAVKSGHVLVEKVMMTVEVANIAYMTAGDVIPATQNVAYWQVPPGTDNYDYI